MPESNENKYGVITRILIGTLVLNWAVSGLKIFWGILTNMTSMTADGFHSLADGASNIIAMVGIHFASQPKDADHPYGHKKYETFFSLGIALLLFLISFELVQTGIQRLRSGHIPAISTANFTVMLVTLAINFFVMRYENKKGRQLQSDILISDSLHTRSDILISLSVIITLVCVKMGITFLDPIVTIAIACVIALSAIAITRQSSGVLCDQIAGVDMREIEKVVLGVKGVVACHKIRTRGRSDDIHIDLHVQVSPTMHMDEAHAISYAIEEALKKVFPGTSDVVVHMEPIEAKSRAQ